MLSIKKKKPIPESYILYDSINVLLQSWNNTIIEMESRLVDARG